MSVFKYHTLLVDEVDPAYSIIVISKDRPDKVMEYVNKVRNDLAGEWTFDDIIEGLPDSYEVANVDDYFEI